MDVNLDAIFSHTLEGGALVTPFTGKCRPRFPSDLRPVRCLQCCNSDGHSTPLSTSCFWSVYEAHGQTLSWSLTRFGSLMQCFWKLFAKAKRATKERVIAFPFAHNLQYGWRCSGGESSSAVLALYLPCACGQISPRLMISSRSGGLLLAV